MLVREGGGSGFGFMPTEDKELLAATQQLCLRSGVASHIKTLFGSVRRHPSTPLHAGAGAGGWGGAGPEREPEPEPEPEPACRSLL